MTGVEIGVEDDEVDLVVESLQRLALAAGQHDFESVVGQEFAEETPADISWIDDQDASRARSVSRGRVGVDHDGMLVEDDRRVLAYH